MIKISINNFKNCNCLQIMYIYNWMFFWITGVLYYPPLSERGAMHAIIMYFSAFLLGLLFINKIYIKILIYIFILFGFISEHILIFFDLINFDADDFNVDFFIWMLGNLSFIGLTYILIISLIIERKKYLSLDENERKIQRSWKKVLERVSYPVIFVILLYIIMTIYLKVFG